MNKHNILIVEDDKEIRDLVIRYLEKNDYNVHSAVDGMKALELINSEEYQLIILDLMIPQLNGYSVLNNLRKEKNTPVLILSARNQEMDKIQALDLGADDYLTKPFTIGELLARVNAQIRRYTFLNNSNTEEKSTIEFKDLILNLDSFEVTKKDKNLRLTIKEFEILKLLVLNPNKVFSKEQIYEAVWKENYLGDDNTIMVQIKRLRNKLEEDSSDLKYIQTVWGIGYKLKTK